MCVRISQGTFDVGAHDEVKARLHSARESLIPATKGLPGVLDYYAGIDGGTGTMVNVSVRDTEEHAQAMASLPEMLALRETFEPLGVRFEPIVNHEVLWRVQASHSESIPELAVPENSIPHLTVEPALKPANTLGSRGGLRRAKRRGEP